MQCYDFYSDSRAQQQLFCSIFYAILFSKVAEAIYSHPDNDKESKSLFFVQKALHAESSAQKYDRSSLWSPAVKSRIIV